jgi:hypothetical protein
MRRTAKLFLTMVLVLALVASAACEGGVDAVCTLQFERLLDRACGGELGKLELSPNKARSIPFS